jgi:mRNA interferase YafQ
MKQIIQSTRFKRDFKLVQKRNWKLDRLREVIERLANDDPLPPRCVPHKLKGDYSGFWECHVAPDWLLVYKSTETELELAAMGSHSDLFK